MRYATFNVLADAYIGYGDYSHADPELLAPGARLDYIVQQVNDLAVDVIGLQEADRNLLEAFEGDRRWQAFGSQRDTISLTDVSLSSIKNRNC